MPKSAAKSASKKPNAAPPPVTRDQAKVQLLTTMCALKDEILRASDEKLRALTGIGGEQAGEPAGDGVTPALSKLLLLADGEVAEVGGERGAPRFVE